MQPFAKGRAGSPMMYRYQPTIRSSGTTRASFWVRHPHWTGAATFLAILAAGLLLGGCECGRLWPCPGGLG